MKFEIDYEQVNSAADAFNLVKKSLNDQFLKESYKINAKLEYNSEKLSLTAKGKGFELVILFTEENAIANLTLGLLLRPLKNSIISKIQNALKGKL